MNTVLSRIHLINSVRWANALNLCILQMNATRLRDFVWLAHGHITNTVQSWTPTMEPRIQVLGSRCLPATNLLTGNEFIAVNNVLEYTLELRGTLKCKFLLSFLWLRCLCAFRLTVHDISARLSNREMKFCMVKTKRIQIVTRTVLISLPLSKVDVNFPSKCIWCRSSTYANKRLFLKHLQIWLNIGFFLLSKTWREVVESTRPLNAECIN